MITISSSIKHFNINIVKMFKQNNTCSEHIFYPWTCQEFDTSTAPDLCSVMLIASRALAAHLGGATVSRSLAATRHQVLENAQGARTMRSVAFKQLENNLLACQENDRLSPTQKFSMLLSH